MNVGFVGRSNEPTFMTFFNNNQVGGSLRLDILDQQLYSL
jgi:hypothetical protein